MGYCISQQDSQFFMREENREPAFKALMEMVKSVGFKFNWPILEELKAAKNLTGAMWEFLWDINSHGNVDIIDFGGEKMCEGLTYAFEAIAPFVESGSYIEMTGEDGERWKYVFENGEFREESATFVYTEQTFFTITKDISGECERMFKSEDIVEVFKEWDRMKYSDKMYFIDVWRYSDKEGHPYPIADIKIQEYTFETIKEHYESTDSGG